VAQAVAKYHSQKKKQKRDQLKTKATEGRKVFDKFSRSYG
jgi:hypothetical protein